MKNTQRLSIKKTQATLAWFAFTCSLVSCGGPPPKAAPTESYALQHFSQDITSSTNQLTLSVNGIAKVPVTIKNPSSDTWFASGKFPVNVAFKWFKGGHLLPIEGGRTPLAKPMVLPNESVSQDVNVVAPDTAGDYELQITLVEEGVSWFNLAGAKPLSIPTTVR